MQRQTNPGPLPTNLKRIRTEQRYSQRHLAEWVGITQAQICRWEQGQLDPKLSQALTIANKLGVSIEEIMGEYGAETANESAGATS